MNIAKPAIVTTMTDVQWASATIVERALNVAHAYNGVRQITKDHGPQIAQFLASVELPEGYPWCAAFVHFCVVTAGADPAKLAPARQCAGVIGWRNWAKAGGRISDTPLRGWLFYWLNGDEGHIGFIRKVTGEPGALILSTIEGNTNDNGSRIGDGVYIKERPVSSFDVNQEHGFIDISNIA